MWPFDPTKPPLSLRYTFKPKEDITAFEVVALVLILYKTALGPKAEISASGLSNIPECLHRHFEDTEQSK